MRGLRGVALERRDPRQHVARVEHVGGDDVAAAALLAHHVVVAARRASGACGTAAGACGSPRSRRPSSSPTGSACAGSARCARYWRIVGRRVWRADGCWLIVEQDVGAAGVRRAPSTGRSARSRPSARGRSRRAAGPGGSRAAGSAGPATCRSSGRRHADRERLGGGGRRAGRRPAARVSGEETAESGSRIMVIGSGGRGAGGVGEPRTSGSRLSFRCVTVKLPGARGAQAQPPARRAPRSDRNGSRAAGGR